MLVKQYICKFPTRTKTHKQKGAGKMGKQDDSEQTAASVAY